MSSQGLKYDSDLKKMALTPLLIYCHKVFQGRQLLIKKIDKILQLPYYFIRSSKFDSLNFIPQRFSFPLLVSDLCLRWTWYEKLKLSARDPDRELGQLLHHAPIGCTQEVRPQTKSLPHVHISCQAYGVLWSSWQLSMSYKSLAYC